MAANRADYQRELERRAVPRVITSEGEIYYAAPGRVPGGRAGTPASPGVYEGRVRVILAPRGARPGTRRGDGCAGAPVMEIGGMMSHGSVAAREYGIPAVVGVAGATQQLETGRRVRVDGEAGQVLPRDGPGAPVR